MSRRLILASSSSARLAVLRAAGIEPVVSPSTVDEDALAAMFGPLCAPDLVARLAQAKAQEVADRVEPGPNDVIVAADSLFEFAGQVFGKARDEAEVLARIRTMRGRRGELHTGHAVIFAGRMACAVATTAVSFADITDAEAEAYTASGEPLGAAGSFTLEGRAAPFIERIDGDPSNVIGLSMPLLRRLLAELGVGIIELWLRPDGAQA